MKILFNLFVVFIVLFFFQGCNTLYQVKLIDLEVVEPGKIKIPEKYNSIAVRYNNANVAYNPHFAEYFRNEQVLTNNNNLDSIASIVYYEMFLNSLKNQVFFDTIIELEKNDFSKTKIIFPEKLQEIGSDNYVFSDAEFISLMSLNSLSSLLQKFPADSSRHEKKQIFDSEYGLYSAKDIQQIADTTRAELFLSLDFFAAFDGITQVPKGFLGLESVYIISHWNFYDLSTRELRHFHNWVDTITWQRSTSALKEAVKELPPRRDAVLNAADIAGSRFVEYLVPHWVGVQRIFYKSGHVELKQTNELIGQGKWKEAALIWKKHIDNPNKRIAAKCMFNLGLACEIEGDIDAAIDWVVKSYHMLERKYEVHDFHCTDYIKILSQRKLDIKILDQQLEFKNF